LIQTFPKKKVGLSIFRFVSNKMFYSQAVCSANNDPLVEPNQRL